MGPWKSAIFYTLMRFFVFVFFFFGFILIGKWLFDSDDIWLPLIGAALASIVVSYFLLAGPRGEMAAGIERKVQERQAKAESERLADADGVTAEDAEAERALRTQRNEGDAAAETSGSSPVTPER